RRRGRHHAARRHRLDAGTRHRLLLENAWSLVLPTGLLDALVHVVCWTRRLERVGPGRARGVRLLLRRLAVGGPPGRPPRSVSATADARRIGVLPVPAAS